MTTTDTFIINGIDVSECEYRKQGFCNCTGHSVVDENGGLNCKALTFGMYCKDNPNCYYKQLKKYQKTSSLVRSTDVYTDICEDCKYEEIYHKAKYSQDEVEYMTMCVLLAKYDYLKNSSSRKVYETNLQLQKTETKVAIDLMKKYAKALEEIKKIIDKDRDERNYIRLTAVSFYKIYYEILQEVLKC